MWSCAYHPNRPVEIVITATLDGSNGIINKVKIWNFNKSLSVSKDVRACCHCDHYCDFYPGVPSLSQVTATHLKNEHPCIPY